MSSSTQRKSQFLGVPFGTATSRLRKLVLFDVLKRHNENVCFKCALPIETADELSIEHKQPWENRDVALFWDLDNIAFSHLRCNKQHYQGTVKLRKVCAENKSWCSFHKTCHNIDEFYPSQSKWSGRHNVCKAGDAERAIYGETK